MIDLGTYLSRAGRLLLAAAACAGMLPGQASAQAGIAAPGSTSGDALAIPADILSRSATADSRRPLVVVNSQIITRTDVEQRVALILAANEGSIAAEELDRLRMQVLRNLIDEKLQTQEARALEMEVTREEVDQSYGRIVADRFGRDEQAMADYLSSIGSSPTSLKGQIEGELAWDRLLRRNIAPFVNVSSEEVSELQQRLEDSRGTAEYRIGEIYLSSTPATHEAVTQNAMRIVEQLREGGSFIAYARQYSEASTAAVGGDLGWIRLEQLQNPQLEAAARDLNPGQLVGPIEIPGGFSILYLIDKRQIGMADARDAILSLRQVSIEFAPGTAEATARARTEAFTRTMEQTTTCTQVDALDGVDGVSVVSNDQLPARSLPEALQAVVLEMEPGDKTPPFGSLDEGVRMLMLCGKTMPEAQAGPSFDQLMAQLEDERINRRAQSYLRDLRRDAVIDYY